MTKIKILSVGRGQIGHGFHLAFLAILNRDLIIKRHNRSHSELRFFEPVKQKRQADSDDYKQHRQPAEHTGLTFHILKHADQINRIALTGMIHNDIDLRILRNRHRGVLILFHIV